METIDLRINFNDCDVHVSRKSYEDLNYDEEIIVILKSAVGVCELILKPLWNVENAEEIVPYKNKFKIGDYYQNTIKSNPAKQGLGAAMHNFLIKHFSEFEVKDIFSTNQSEDGYGITTEAMALWHSSQRHNKASFDESLNRFKLNLKQV